MMKDISNHTIVVLVILTVVISFLGTWTVLEEISDMKIENGNIAGAATVQNNDIIGTGEIKITVEEPQIPPTGEVHITIEK